EFFATTLDVYLILGEVAERPDDRGTADGRPATREWARDRLARMLCADRETSTEEQTRAVAERAAAAQRTLILDAVRRGGPAPAPRRARSWSAGRASSWPGRWPPPHSRGPRSGHWARSWDPGCRRRPVHTRWRPWSSGNEPVRLTPRAPPTPVPCRPSRR